jgi:hypothetical protein
MTHEDFSKLAGIPSDAQSAAQVTAAINAAILSGPTSSRPTTTIVGLEYFDTDEMALMVWDGSAWAFVQGLRWVDVPPTFVSVGTAAAALTRKELRGPNTSLYDFFVHNQLDVLYMGFQFPHGWARTPVRPHAHITPSSWSVGAAGTSLGNARFQWKYCWSGVGTGLVIPESAGWSTTTTDVPITIGDQYTELITGPLITPPAAATASSHLHVQVTRLTTDPADTYETASQYGTAAANLALLSVDCHAQVRTAGTITEY